MRPPGLPSGAMGTLLVLAERYEGWHAAVDIIGPLTARRTRTSCVRLAMWGLVETRTVLHTCEDVPRHTIMVRVTPLGRDVAAAYRARNPLTQQAAK